MVKSQFDKFLNGEMTPHFECSILRFLGNPSRNPFYVLKYRNPLIYITSCYVTSYLGCNPRPDLLIKVSKLISTFYYATFKLLITLYLS